MKKYFILLILFFAPVLSAYSGFLEGKVAYYYPTNNTTRILFKNGVLYKVEGTVHGFSNFFPCLSVGMLPISGHSIGSRSKDKLLIIPVEFGMKYIYQSDHINFYAGSGILAGYAHDHDLTSFIVKKRSKWGVGGIFKGGSMIFIRSSVYLNLFLEYSLLSFSYSDSEFTKGRNAKINGLSAGGGVGVKF